MAVFFWTVSTQEDKLQERGKVTRPGLLCAVGDHVLPAVIRRDLAAKASRLVAHEWPRSEIVNKVLID